MTTEQDGYLEFCYTVHAAKYAYQQEGVGRLAEPLLPREGEHLCIQSYTATGTAKVVAQRDDALLTFDEIQKALAGSDGGNSAGAPDLG